MAHSTPSEMALPVRAVLGGAMPAVQGQRRQRSAPTCTTDGFLLAVCAAVAAVAAAQIVWWTVPGRILVMGVICCVAAVQCLLLALSIVRRRGVMHWLPEHTRHLLQHTTLLEFMRDDSALKHLMPYLPLLLPLTNAETAMYLQNAPEDVRGTLLRPGLWHLLPRRLQRMLLGSRKAAAAPKHRGDLTLGDASGGGSVPHDPALPIASAQPYLAAAPLTGSAAATYAWAEQPATVMATATQPLAHAPTWPSVVLRMIVQRRLHQNFVGALDAGGLSKQRLLIAAIAAAGISAAALMRNKRKPDRWAAGFAVLSLGLGLLRYLRQRSEDATGGSLVDVMAGDINRLVSDLKRGLAATLAAPDTASSDVGISEGAPFSPRNLTVAYTALRRIAECEPSLSAHGAHTGEATTAAGATPHIATRLDFTAASPSGAATGVKSGPASATRVTPSPAAAASARTVPRGSSPLAATPALTPQLTPLRDSPSFQTPGAPSSTDDVLAVLSASAEKLREMFAGAAPGLADLLSQPANSALLISIIICVYVTWKARR